MPIETSIANPFQRKYTPEEIENFRRIRAEVRELEAAELARVDEVCKRYQW